MDDRVHLADGSWLGYHCSGHGPEHLVLIHGFAANMGTWFDLAPSFPPERYTLHLLDLPAHGTASRRRRNDYSIPAQAERIATFLQTRSIHQATLIGHSMGGAVVLALAIRYLELSDDRISRLVLLDAPAYPQPLPDFIDLLGTPLVGPLILALTPPASIARHGLQAVLADHNLITPARIERYAATFRTPGTALALSRCAAQIIPPNAGQLTAAYRHMPQPTLLIWGEQDRVVRPEQGERLSNDLPRAELTLLPLCGHNPHEEYPEQTYRLIQAFLDRHPL